MRRLRGPIILIVMLTASCGGGGGGGNEDLPVALWGQFRQNTQRTGQGFGIVENNEAIIDFEVVDESPGQNPSRISSSPVIDTNDILYIASEGGTLAAFSGDDDLNRVWSVTSCGACPALDRSLGQLVSTPAVYTFVNRDNTGETDIMVGSMDNAFFVFRAVGEDFVDENDCSVCFWRGNTSLRQQILRDTPGTDVRAEFVSSPTFDINLGTGLIAGIFIGARITVTKSDLTEEVFGKLYAINNDGSLRWEFPRPGDPKIGAITSSPTTSQGDTLYFTTDADPQNPGRGNVLYSLTETGNLKRSVAIPNLTDPALLFSPSVISGVTLFVPGVMDGTVHAMNPDGSFRWNATFAGERFASSFAIGTQNEPTPTAEGAVATPTPTGTVELLPLLTPTPTETPLRLLSTLFGIAESGRLVVLDASDGAPVSPPDGAMPSAPVEGTVVASPALSADLLLVYGTTAGQLFTINTANGQLVRFCHGGSAAGFLCTDDVDCPCTVGVDCPSGCGTFCSGGSRAGRPCTLDLECPAGACNGSAWPILLPRSCTGDRLQFCSSDEECAGKGICERPAIRSSPAIDLDGTVYFGADDGRVYAVASLDEAPLPTSTPTARPLESRPEATATVTPPIEPSPTPEPSTAAATAESHTAVSR